MPLVGILKDLPNSNINTSWPWSVEVNPSLYSYKIKWPKISIVTPSYNQGQFIEETIRSILLRNYPNLEYIIIDGGSTDNTVEIIKKYDKWINFWLSEPDRGQSEAINKGLQVATGKIFNWLNSDDYLEPNALYHVAKSFKEEVLCVSGNINYIKEGQLLKTSFEKIINIDKNNTIANPIIKQPSTFYWLDTILCLGKVNTNLHYTMDLELWLRFISKYSIYSVAEIPEVLVNFRLHKTSKTIASEFKFNLDYLSILYGLLKYNNKEDILTLFDYIPINREETIGNFHINDVALYDLLNNIILYRLVFIYKKDDFLLLKRILINSNKINDHRLFFKNVKKLTPYKYLPNWFSYRVYRKAKALVAPFIN